MSKEKQYFRDLTFPPTYKYSSDSNNIPLEFYEEAFPIAKQIDLLLGYFSSNAIKVLSKSIAEFIFNGGKMRLVTNHVYSINDYSNLIKDNTLENEDKIIDIFNDLSEIEKNLSFEGQHFFDCLKYLIKEDKLEIFPVKFNNVDLAHCKKMLLYDGRDCLLTEGSINFTLPALIKNSESFQVDAPWNGDISKMRIDEEKKNFKKIIEGIHPSYTYIDKDQIEIVINSIGRDKDISDLLDDSLSLTSNNFSKRVEFILNKKIERFNSILPKRKNIPNFPYGQGPRDYQKDAYNSWVKNNYSGVFAMATGTGKTITSLNCLLNIYKADNRYNAIILVPSISLLNQWEKEVLKFNFSKIIKVGGGNNWEKDFANYTSNFAWGITDDLIIISTYASFVSEKFQKYFKNIEKDFTLIADEAHNMGANNIKSKLNDICVPKKIGLSATPKRIYDLEGTLALDKFFNDSPPYIYSFDMKRALDKGFLTEYKYYPKIVQLSESEFAEYSEISKKLLKYFDFKEGKFKDNPNVERLLIKRKNIIHKAENKLELFNSIVQELINEGKSEYIFAYLPEGFTKNKNGDEIKIIDEYILSVNKSFPRLKLNSYTYEDQKNLEDILKGFEEGKIDILFAMKMLDEGVDVPRAEVGIFASSTGNPRQFIQRRGRLLRKHQDKSHAIIYDMVVIPNIESYNKELFTIERNLVKSELNRVGYFASLSMNFYDSKDALDLVCKKYNLDLDTIISQL